MPYEADSGIPVDWDYNPSGWDQRWPIIALSLFGFAIAGYLSMYQLGVFAHVWEPFLGDGSQRILTSWVSQLLHPVPDAALGAFGYLVDSLGGAIGGSSRWRTMPWMVILFGFAVGPLGIVSVTLVILQPVFFHTWCTLCVASAVISVLMIGPAMDEILASLQYIKRQSQHGRSAWRVFWGF
jgi:hypothetical protein